MSQGSTIGFLNGELLHCSYRLDSQKQDYARLKARILFERGKKVSRLKIILAPPVRFLKVYIIKKGFLSGFHGLAMSLISAHQCFLTNFYLCVMNREDKKAQQPNE